MNDLQYQLLSHLVKNTAVTQKHEIEHDGFWDLGPLSSPDITRPLLSRKFIELDLEGKARITEAGRKAYEEERERRAPTSSWTPWAQKALRNMMAKGIRDPEAMQYLQEVMRTGQEPTQALKDFVAQHELE